MRNTILVTYNINSFMTNIRLMLLTIAVLFTFQGYAQEEFLGDKSGLIASYSQNFSFNTTLKSDEIIRVRQLGLYCNNGLMLSGGYSAVNQHDFYLANIGYLYNHDDNNRIKCYLGVTYGELIDQYKVASLGIGLIKALFPNSSFPFSLSVSNALNVFFIDKSIDSQHTASIGYTQAIFAKNTLFPVIGISKAFVFADDNSKYSDSWQFHTRLTLKITQ